MSTTTIRVTKKTHRVLRRLAERDGASIQQIIDQMLENFRREQFLDQVNKGYEALRKNPKAWMEELDERRLHDSALWDGLEDD